MRRFQFGHVTAQGKLLAFHSPHAVVSTLTSAEGKGRGKVETAKNKPEGQLARALAPYRPSYLRTSQSLPTFGRTPRHRKSHCKGSTRANPSAKSALVGSALFWGFALGSESPARGCRAAALDHRRAASLCCCPCLKARYVRSVAFKAFPHFLQVAGLAVVKWLSVDVPFPYRLRFPKLPHAPTLRCFAASLRSPRARPGLVHLALADAPLAPGGKHAVLRAL